MSFEMLWTQIGGYDHRGSKPYISNAKQSYSTIQTDINAIGDFRKPYQIENFFLFLCSVGDLMDIEQIIAVVVICW